MSKRPTITQKQRLTIVNGMLGFVVLILILQLWLFTSTMESYLGGDYVIIWPAVFVSLACVLLNLGLLVYLGRLDHTYDTAEDARYARRTPVDHSQYI